MKRKITFFACPSRCGIFFAESAKATRRAESDCPVSAASATAPNPHPAVRRNCRRDVGKSKLLQGMDGELLHKA